MIADSPTTLSTEHFKLSTEDIIVENCNKYPITEHTFFQTLKSEVPNLKAYWSYFANFEPLTVRVPDWFASLLLRVDNMELKGLLSIIIYDELGRGDLNKIHSALMDKLVRGLHRWRVEQTGIDPLAPGRSLAQEFDQLYFSKIDDDELFVLGSIVAGEVYGGQMAYFMGEQIRRQNKVDLSIFEWIFIHEEVEADHAKISRIMSEILPTSGPGFESVIAGAKWKRTKFWEWLDEIYSVAYSEIPEVVHS
ncbi:MAG: iron-containing redox enzyme family protein [Xenococcaceae cyanobacterium]